MWQYLYCHIYNSKHGHQKVSVSVCMLSNNMAEFVLVLSIVIMHRSILNKTYFEHLEIDHTHT